MASDSYWLHLERSSVSVLTRAASAPEPRRKRAEKSSQLLISRRVQHASALYPTAGFRGLFARHRQIHPIFPPSTHQQARDPVSCLVLTRTFYVHSPPIPDPPATKDSNDQTLPGRLDANSMLRDKIVSRPLIPAALLPQAYVLDSTLHTSSLSCKCEKGCGGTSLPVSFQPWPRKCE